jgi:hypothetical protein
MLRLAATGGKFDLDIRQIALAPQWQSSFAFFPGLSESIGFVRRHLVIRSGTARCCCLLRSGSEGIAERPADFTQKQGLMEIA